MEYCQRNHCKDKLWHQTPFFCAATAREQMMMLQEQASFHTILAWNPCCKIMHGADKGKVEKKCLPNIVTRSLPTFKRTAICPERIWFHVSLSLAECSLLAILCVVGNSQPIHYPWFTKHDSRIRLRFTTIKAKGKMVSTRVMIRYVLHQMEKKLG